MDQSSYKKSDYEIPHLALARRANHTPDAIYLRQPISRFYNEYTCKEVFDNASRLATAFLSMGLSSGDKVAILSKNVAEWFIADFAISMAGMISVPVYPSAGVETIEYILEHSESKVLIVGKLDSEIAIEQVLPRNGLTTISTRYCNIECQFDLSALLAINTPIVSPAQPTLDDTFSLIYTSGSTGHPKAAVVSYRNIAYGANAMVKKAGLTNKDRLLSYLPLAHVAERSVIQYASVYSGAQVTFVESLETFAEDIQNVQPSVFFSVPRLWLKFQSKVLAEMPQAKLNTLLRVPFLSRIVKNKIKTKLGLSQARIIGSGTAPIPKSTLEWFSAIGVDIAEGWGMTETSGTAIMNHPYNAKKIGTIGKPVEGTEVKISDQGEILLRSEGMVSRYYNNQEKTDEVFKGGWLYTGDKGELDEDGYIRITGRVKDQFKSGKGKYVVPVPIESRLFENHHIEQACVMGAGLAQPVATVVINEEARQSATQRELSESLEDSLIVLNESLEAHEKLDRIFVANTPWSVENNLLTPTLKIKRSELEAKYRNDIEQSLSAKSYVAQKRKLEKVIWL